jgi:Type VI secretion system/phage-baseplate injector OB domain
MATSPVRARKLYGKYRGTIVDNVDPMLRGRVRVSVPGVLNTRTKPWAEMCLPAFDGLMAAAAPAIGSTVLVEFEAGDTSRPICTGKLWSGQDQPVPPSGPLTLGVPSQATLSIGDAGGRGITFRTALGATIAVGDTGITISNGQGASISLNGPSVSINNGALVVL